MCTHSKVKGYKPGPECVLFPVKGLERSRVGPSTHGLWQRHPGLSQWHCRGQELYELKGRRA